MSSKFYNVEIRNMFSYQGYEIPEHLVDLTGGGVDTFEAISEVHMSQIHKWLTPATDSKFLEIGCGIGRDAIPLSNYLSIEGSYLGVDIVGESIAWCKDNISKQHSNFEFVHYDVRDQLHNPEGKTLTSDIRLPLQHKSIDHVILWSVFTHMFPSDVIHYLKEFRRVMKRDAQVFATCFIYNDEILESARNTNLTPFNLRFEFEMADGIRFNDPVYPVGAVAYSQSYFEDMIRNSGLKLLHQLNGSWSGYYDEPQDGQDVMILGL